MKLKELVQSKYIAMFKGSLIMNLESVNLLIGSSIKLFSGTIQFSDGYIVCFQNGIVHKDNEPAVKHVSSTYKAWYKNNKLHRSDGPAITIDRIKQWFQTDQKHREDGPAVIWANGNEEYWLFGDQYTKEGLERLIKK